MITARKASLLIKAYCGIFRIPLKSVTCENVSFADLARDDKVIARVRLYEAITEQQSEALKNYARNNGFIVLF